MSPAPDHTVFIKEVSWEDIKEAGGAKGWYYPQNYISQWMPLYRPAHRNIISLFIGLALISLAMGVILPIIIGDWWFLLIVVGALVSWKLNR